MNVSDIIKLSHCMIKTRKVRFTTTVIVLGTVFGIIFAGLAILNEVKNAVFEQCAIDASVSISNDDCVPLMKLWINLTGTLPLQSQWCRP